MNYKENLSHNNVQSCYQPQSYKHMRTGQTEDGVKLHVEGPWQHETNAVTWQEEDNENKTNFSQENVWEDPS